MTFEAGNKTWNAQPREYHHDDLNCSIQKTIKRNRSRTLVILHELTSQHGQAGRLERRKRTGGG
jgi:hypothetical protein